MRTIARQLIFGSVLSAGIAAARLAEHTPNVAPVAAAALLAGSYFSWPLALLVPLGGMLLSDAFIGFASLPITLAVYGSFALSAVIGRTLINPRRAGRIATASLLSSASFYLITNAAVWKFSGMYPPGPAGLLLSYYFAIPFFRLTLLGDLAYTSVFFLAAALGPALVRQVIPTDTYHSRRAPLTGTGTTPDVLPLTSGVEEAPVFPARRLG